MTKTVVGGDEPNEPMTTEEYKRQYRERIAALDRVLRAALPKLR